MTLYKLVRYTFGLLFKIAFRMKVTGSESLPRRGGFILASNHSSYFDPLIIGFASFRELDFMAKRELFRNFFFALMIRSINVFPLKRGAHDADAVVVAKDRIRRGRALAIFPEGTRSINGELNSPHKGVAYLADVTGAPVVPCYIKGSNNVLPAGSKRVRFAKLNVSFGRAVQYKKGEDYKVFADTVMREIAKLKNADDRRK